MAPMTPITPTADPQRTALPPTGPAHAGRPMPTTRPDAERSDGAAESGLSWAQLAGITEYQSWLRHLG